MVAKSVREPVSAPSVAAATLGGVVIGAILPIVGWWLVLNGYAGHALSVLTQGFAPGYGFGPLLLVFATGIVTCLIVLWSRAAALAAGAVGVIGMAYGILGGATVHLGGIDRGVPGFASPGTPWAEAVGYDIAWAASSVAHSLPTVLLTATWIGIAVAWLLPAPRRRTPDPRDVRRGILAVAVAALGALIAVSAWWLAQRLEWSALARVRGDPVLAWPWLPIVAMALAIVPALAYTRRAAAAAGGATASLVALGVSILAVGLLGAIPFVGVSFAQDPADQAWRLSAEDFVTAVVSTAYHVTLLVLVAAWLAIGVAWLVQRRGLA